MQSGAEVEVEGQRHRSVAGIRGIIQFIIFWFPIMRKGKSAALDG